MSAPGTFPDANDVLFGGSGAPAVQWQNPQTNQDFPVGTSYEGYITKLDSTQQRNIQDKSKLDVWPDGRPKMVALVTIQTNQRDPQVQYDDGQRTVWVSGKYLTNAVKEAVRRVGAQRLDVGGYLKVTLTGYGKPEPGFRAPRLYEVSYTPAAPGAADANAAMGMTPQPAQPAQQQGWYDQGGTLPQGGPAYVATPQQQPVPQAQQQLPLPQAQPVSMQGGPATAPQPAQQQPVAQPAPAQAQAAPPAAAPAAGMPDLSTLDPNARALVERMYANQQGGQQA
jgi:hypothetical protein